MMSEKPGLKASDRQQTAEEQRSQTLEIYQLRKSDKAGMGQRKDPTRSECG